MSDEQLATQTPAPTPEERPQGMISAAGALRLLLILLAIWTLFSGLALIFFQDGADATIAGGFEGDQGAAAQRLIGVHLLVLAALYGLLVWKPEQYAGLMWVPYAAQTGVVFVTIWDLLSGDRNFTGGVLPLIVAIVFLVLFLYVWRAGRQEAAPEEEPSPASQPGALPESRSDPPAPTAT